MHAKGTIIDYRGKKKDEENCLVQQIYYYYNNNHLAQRHHRSETRVSISYFISFLCKHMYTTIELKNVPRLVSAA